MRKLLDQIIIHQHSLECVFFLQRIAAELNLERRDSTYTICLPITWRRWGSEQKLILGRDSQVNTQAFNLKVIQNAVTKALIWSEELPSGAVTSVRALETREKAGASYVRRILKLAYLSPIILHDIKSGKIPKTFTLEST